MAYEDNFQEFKVLKDRARRTSVPVETLLKFKDRSFRGHLVALYSNGSPLSELAEYVAVFYTVEVTPQQLRKILQRSNREAWVAASDNYKQRRLEMKQKLIHSAKGE